MPLPSWAGVLGMLRTIWRWRRTLPSAVVVAPARMLMTSWPSRSAGASSRPTRGSICGLMRQHDDVGVGDGVLVAGRDPDAVVALQGVSPVGPRMAGHDLIRRDLAAAKQAGDHGLGHDARADGGDGAVGQRHRLGSIATRRCSAGGTDCVAVATRWPSGSWLLPSRPRPSLGVYRPDFAWMDRDGSPRPKSPAFGSMADTRRRPAGLGRLRGDAGDHS